LEVFNGTKMFIAYYPLKAVNNVSTRWTCPINAAAITTITAQPYNNTSIFTHAQGNKEEMLIQSTCHYNDHICLTS
jgi:hypothetical protein